MKINGYEFDPFSAVGVAAGNIPNQPTDRVLAAWQYLVVTGGAWRLTPAFARVAYIMIGAGEIYSARDFDELFAGMDNAILPQPEEVNA